LRNQHRIFNKPSRFLFVWELKLCHTAPICTEEDEIMPSHGFVERNPTPLEKKLHDQIKLRTGGRIKELHVDEKADRVVVWGYVATVYLKQLAIQAVQETLVDTPFEAVIEVIVDLEREESTLLTVRW
jgi:hypothetical protein